MSPADFYDAYVPLRSKTDGAWFVDETLRPRLVADANDQNRNLTDVAIAILCAHFELEYEPNGRASSPKRDEAMLRLRLPLALDDAIARERGTRAEVIRRILSDHYGLAIPAKPTRSRTPAAA